MYSKTKTIFVMFFSPLYAIKYVLCYCLQIKYTDGVQNFNHIVSEDDLFHLFLSCSGPLIIDKACFMVKPFSLA